MINSYSFHIKDRGCCVALENFDAEEAGQWAGSVHF